MAVNNSTIPTAPRLTGNPRVDNNSIMNWAQDLYRVVLVEQKIPERLNQIATLAQITTTISNPPTQAQVEELKQKINAIIAAAAPADS